jgi:hypothetical protein
MTWNYRVLRRTFVEDGDVKEYYGVHEVYYDKGGNPEMCTSEAISIEYFSDLDGVRWAMEKIAEALAKPVLDYEDFGNGT